MGRIIWRLSPFIVLIGGLILGAIVLFWSKDIGIWSFQIPADSPYGPPGQEVGFAHAWNWSIGLILLPICAALSLISIQRARNALVTMHRNGMLVYNDFRTITPEDRDRIWVWVCWCAAGLALLFAALLMWLALAQFNEVIGVHLDAGKFLHGLTQADKTQEFDWSVAALLDSEIDLNRNRTFAFVVYVVYLGLFLGVVFGLIAFVITLAAAASLTMFESPGIRIVPNASSKDPRRGFEALEEMFITMLVVLFLAYFAAYLVHIQNIYLRLEYPTFGAFFFGAATDAWQQFQAQKEFGLPQLLSVGFGWALGESVPFGEDSLTTSLAGIIVFAILLFIIRLMLHFVARHAQRSLERHTGKEIGKMTTWPVSWPRLTTLVAGLIFAVMALFLFRFGVLIFLGALVLAAIRIYIDSRAAAGITDGNGNAG